MKKKLLGIKADPKKISFGYALGVFLGTTPFIGIKVFIALIFTSLFGWSKVASVAGVYHINILTAPLFYGFSYLVGRTVTGSEVVFEFPETLSISAFYNLFAGNLNIFMSLLVGGLLLGVPMAIAAYFFSMRVFRRFTLRPPASSLPVCDRLEKAEATHPRTLITGASQGLGREMAIECARRGHDLVLVALPGRNLDAFCRELSFQFGVQADFIETDLTDKEAICRLAEMVQRRFRINFLVNNAGTGGTLPFDTSSVDYLDNIIQLNIRALSMLTRLMVPELRSHRRACVLNVSSMAAFSPIPFKTVYPASKAFVYNFSRSLNRELKDTSVRVAVVHPGPILTNPDVTARIIRQGSAGKIGLLMGSEIARIAIDGVNAGREVIIPGFMNKVNLLLIRVVPDGIRLQMLSRVIRREIRADLLQAA